MNKSFLTIISLLTLLLAVGCSYQIPTEADHDVPFEDLTGDFNEEIIEEDDFFEEDLLEEDLFDDAEEVIVEDLFEEDPILVEEDAVEEVVVEEVQEPAPSVQDKDGLPVKVFDEGSKVSFPNLKNVDADGDKITYSFTSPLDSDGEWQTEVGDAGEYKITITASDGKESVAQDIILIINSTDAPPVFEKMADIRVTEGDVVTLNPKAVDPEGKDITYSYSGWMDSKTYKTTKQDAGTHNVKITASDGIRKSSTYVKVTVIDLNMPPLLQKLDDFTVTEGHPAVINVVTADPDGDKLTVKYSGGLFDDEGLWQTEEGDKGVYTVTVTVSDGKLSVTDTVQITVVEKNNPPTLEDFDDIEVDEGDAVKIKPVAFDSDGDKLSYTYSGWMTSSSYTTTYTDAGTHKVDVTVSDGINKVKKTVKVIVNDVNQPPVVDWDLI